MQKTNLYPDIFNELKEQVREEGLLQRVPVRGSIEMVLILIAMTVLLSSVDQWHPILFALALTIVFTRAVFVSHDLLHTQYFQNKSFSKKLTYPFSSFILSNSPTWWDFKHNVNHHTYCNIIEKDEDIRALDGAFTKKKGNRTFFKENKFLIFWGSMFFMYPAFIRQSYKYVIKHKLWGELAMMLIHWPLVWGTILSHVGLVDTLIILVVFNFTLSPWLAFGFITNHLGCETFTEEEAKDFSWMELQMRGSRSLSGGKFVHWFYGGLDTQIEHHLFPKAPRFNLLRVKEITQTFAKVHNIPYFESTPIQAYVQINEALKEY